MRTFTSLSLAALLCACGSSQDTDTTTTPVTEAAPATPAETPAETQAAPAEQPATPEAAETPAEPATPPAPQLSDGQIGAFLAAANKAEIDSSELVKKSKNAEVKKLAAMLIKDHKAADKKGSALLVKAGVQPDDTAADVQSLTSKAQATIDQLKALKGAELDKAYVDAQVTMHQEVIDALAQKILPAAQNAELKAFIGEIQPKLQAHLDQAKALQAKLSGAGGGGG
jgi:putative membrane protein